METTCLQSAARHTSALGVSGPIGPISAKLKLNIPKLVPVTLPILWQLNPFIDPFILHQLVQGTVDDTIRPSVNPDGKYWETRITETNTSCKAHHGQCDG